VPKFSVVCRTAEGQTIREARYNASRAELLAQLRAAGLVPISVEQSEATEEGAEKRRSPLLRLRKVKVGEIALAFRTLATMLGGGLPIIDSLTDVAEQSDNARFKEILLSVAGEVRKGNMLSAALADYPKVFGPLTCSLVQAGEESGTLAHMLSDLAEYLELQVDLRRKIKAGTRYPLFILGFFIVAMSFIFLYIVPKFKAIFATFGAELPLLTRVVMYISSQAASHLFYVGVVVVAIGVGIHMWKKTEKGRRSLDAFMLRIPVVGKLIHQIIIARVARTLGLLIQSGIPVVDALRLTEAAAGNVPIGEHLKGTRQNIVRGSSLSEELASRPYFPRVLVRMTSAGESSGNLGSMLSRVADHYTRESSTTLDVLMAMLEPAMLVLLGIAVGIAVIAIYLPIFSLAKAVT